MKVCKVSDYETAFNLLVEWLNQSRGVVEDNMPDVNDEVPFAKANGYLTCCNAAIVMAEEFQRKLMKDGSKKDD